MKELEKVNWKIGGKRLERDLAGLKRKGIAVKAKIGDRRKEKGEKRLENDGSLEGGRNIERERENEKVNRKKMVTGGRRGVKEIVKEK